jgi:hypothetical protein
VSKADLFLKPFDLPRIERMLRDPDKAWKYAHTVFFLAGIEDDWRKFLLTLADLFDAFEEAGQDEDLLEPILMALRQRAVQFGRQSMDLERYTIEFVTTLGLGPEMVALERARWVRQAREASSEGTKGREWLEAYHRAKATPPQEQPDGERQW